MRGTTKDIALTALWAGLSYHFFKKGKTGWGVFFAIPAVGAGSAALTGESWVSRVLRAGNVGTAAPVSGYQLPCSTCW